ncbi:BQ2448_5333 [Microbotryum intermedium]|uniref:BQ2448_5333 protein n=1 Tax=Microbotryum intermedium TaxID=269621 RepID=A0A238F0P9_9BASI|nr:BQ2448_5333 [Microbotryum intermedium]
MLFARSGIVASTLLIVQSSFSIATHLSDKAVHELGKRITCGIPRSASVTRNLIPPPWPPYSLTAAPSQSPPHNACVSCASLYKNTSTCTRSVPVTCSYGAVNSARKCAAVNCTGVAGTYLSDDASECLSCNDLKALTFSDIGMTISCKANYTLWRNKCQYGVPYGVFYGHGFKKPFLAKEQPVKPVQTYPLQLQPEQCARIYPEASGDGTSFSPATCNGQNGALNQNLVKMHDPAAAVLFPGNCTLLATNPFIAARGAPPPPPPGEGGHVYKSASVPITSSKRVSFVSAFQRMHRNDLYPLPPWATSLCSLS